MLSEETNVLDTLSFEISNAIFLAHYTLLLVCAVFLVRILTFVSVVSKKMLNKILIMLLHYCMKGLKILTFLLIASMNISNFC